MTGCRAYVAGFGTPGMRDLDFGRQVVDWFQQLEWPDEVVVENLSCSAPLVLHRLQELRPAKVVLLGAVPRGVGAPAELRRFRLDDAVVDLDNTLAMARQWGGLPADTVVIEVEPADMECGLGFSDVLSDCFDPILDMVRDELSGEVGVPRDFDPVALSTVVPSTEPWEPTGPMGDLVGYARQHAVARVQCRPAPAVAGIALAGRLRPWGVCVESGGDWFDAVPVGDGLVGIVVGNVDGRGVEVAPAMTDLRAAARAYAVVDGASPARVVGHLDRLAEATGVGHRARLLYLTLQPATGEVRFANAAGCPPLLLDGRPARGRFVDHARSAPLGELAGIERPEGTLRVTAGSTLLLCTDGLVEHRKLSRAAGLERLQRAAMAGPGDLDDLCDHILSTCTNDGRRDDDICLLGVRIRP
jgi:hydrogenase maturation protease